MSQRELPSGSDFWSRFIAIVSLCGTGLAVVVALYLVVLLRMPPEQMKALALIVTVLFVPATPISISLCRRAVRPVRDWLDAPDTGDASIEIRRAAYESVVNLPVRVLVLSFVMFTLPAGLSVLGLMAWFPELGSEHAILMSVSVLSAAGLSSIVEGALLKRWLSPVRDALALAVPNPMQRSELTRPVSLLVKLQVAIAVCTLVPVVLTVLLGQTRSTHPLESYAERLQLAQARYALVPYDETGDFDLRAAEDSELAEMLKSSVLVYDRIADEVVAGNAEALGELNLSRVRDSGAERGTGDQLYADTIYAWHNTYDGHYAVIVASPREAIVSKAENPLLIFLGVISICLVMSLGIGRLVAEDVGGATRELGKAADRLAAGDLRRVSVVESEDEMGTLARAFDAMSSSLRESVDEVAETAAGVEAAASNISDVSGSLLAAAQTQGSDVKHVVEAMELAEGKASEIARSSKQLSHLVADSTSSVLELGATGEELKHTAGSLSERVEEVLSTVEETVRSIRHVGRETGTLVEAAADTSSSMNEMATAMKHVDDAAAETAKLSQLVVEASELGHQRVSDTIEGIESIRSATGTAHSVIQRLGGRAREIGGVVDVIGEVADETNLLALNAAIIAAQAGEHGRAFSVVAEQIKRLAERVLSSTKEISSLVGSVQEESQSAVEAMAEGARSVAVGVERSSQAGQSLEEITQISRRSGLRIREIVESVQEQTHAAGHVVDLMERVRTGVQSIQNASMEQEKGNERVFDATQAMSEVAQQLHLTTSEQAAGLARIRESVSGVRDQMEAIDGSLQEQAGSTNQVVGFLEEVSSRSIANERNAQRVGELTAALAEQAVRLRAGMGRFLRR